jgi:hypothetical protein
VIAGLVVARNQATPIFNDPEILKIEDIPK